MSEPSHLVRSLLLQELRIAVQAKGESGVDPGQLTADLERRLRQVAGWQEHAEAVGEQQWLPSSNTPALRPVAE